MFGLLSEKTQSSLKYEGYYCTSIGQIKGVLTLNEDVLMFDPIKCEGNNEHTDLLKFQAIVDLQNIKDFQSIRFPNYLRKTTLPNTA